MTLCAPYYGHIETQWHRSIRPISISNDPHEEKILASKIDMNVVPGIVLKLHKTRQAELQVDKLSQTASKKRTREEAEEDLVVAEIDAKRDLANAKRDLAVAELEFARDRGKLMLRLAADGNVEALKLLFTLMNSA